MNVRSYKQLAAVALFLVVAVGGYFLWSKLSVPSLEARYRTVKVERGDLTQMAAANGTLNPVVLVNVGTQVSGTVKKWYADFNDQVKEGQILLDLDPALFQAQVRQSEATLANAQSQLKLAEANVARTQKLFEQEYVSRQDLDTAVQAVEAARASVAQAGAQLAKDRINLAYSVIRSPVSGVVVSREVDIGQTVAASFQTPTLFKIAQDLAKMQIDSSYAEADVGNLRVGQAVVFRVDAYPNRTFKGAVRQVRLNPTTLQNVVTYDVVVAVDNPDQILMPGMTAYVNIIVATRNGVLLIPNAALRFRPTEPNAPTASTASTAPTARQDRAAADTAKGKVESVTGTVYVLENGLAKPVRVSLGITDARYSEVTAGALKEGDAIIVEDRQPAANKPSVPGMRLF